MCSRTCHVIPVSFASFRSRLPSWARHLVCRMLQVNDKCDRILGELHTERRSGTIAAYHKRNVAPPIIPPPASPRFLASLWLPVAQFWSSLDTPRRKRGFAAICCLLTTLVLGLILLAILLRFLYAGPAFENFAVRPVTTHTTAAQPGEVMLDLTLSLSRPADVYYVVVNADVKLDAQDVIDTAAADDVASLSRVAVACGELNVPRASANFTFTISSNGATSECQDYRLLIDGTADGWARAARCSRCPSLASTTTYQVRTASSAQSDTLLDSACLATCSAAG